MRVIFHLISFSQNSYHCCALNLLAFVLVCLPPYGFGKNYSQKTIIRMRRTYFEDDSVGRMNPAATGITWLLCLDPLFEALTTFTEFAVTLDAALIGVLSLIGTLNAPVNNDAFPAILFSDKELKGTLRAGDSKVFEILPSFRLFSASIAPLEGVFKFLLINTFHLTNKQ